MPKTGALTITNLSEAVAARQALSQAKSYLLLQELFAEILEAAKSGTRVTIRGFGSFEFRERKGRSGRNPKTGEQVVVPPTRVLAFKAAEINRERRKA